MIRASLRQTTPLRADLHAATAVLAQIPAGRTQLNARLTPIHRLITRGSIKYAAGSTRSRCGRPAPRSKSP
jgi:hypothetical protein